MEVYFMPQRLDFPTLGNASFVELDEPGRIGLLITQNGRTYFARNHRLTPVIVDIIHAAIDVGLTAFWKHGHPRDDRFEGGANFHLGAHHIQFSRDHDSPWTFVIGKENKPPYPEHVTFSKKLEPILNAAAKERGLNSQFKYQVFGPKNLYVEIEHLAFALGVTTQLEVQDFLAEPLPRQIPIPRYPSYVREEDLQAAIANALGARGFYVRREVNLGSGRVDLVAIGGGRHLVIEVKLFSVGRPVFDQIEKYLSAYVSTGAADVSQVRAVLIARNFQDDLVQHIEKTKLKIQLVTYSLAANGALVFTERNKPHGVSELDF